MTGDGVARRDLLRLAVAAAGGAVLGGCSSASPSPTPGTGGRPVGSAPAGPATGPTAVLSAAGPPPWSTLRRQLSGRLVLPHDRAYAADRLLYNPRFDSVHPAALVRAATPHDVAAAVVFAQHHRLPVAVRSGGHSYGGWSTGPGLVLDTSAMAGVSADRTGQAARIGAGARLVDVYDRLGRAGVGIAAGSCPSVGIAGLTLGGGVGVLARSWGLTCDSVTAVQVVTADGRVLTADARRHPDLFWACRGGGGGSFGVVTGFAVRTRPAPAMTTFTLRWGWSSAADVLAVWQRWVVRADRRLWSTLKLLGRPGPGGPGRPAGLRVVVAGTWTGPAAELDHQLAPLLAAAGRPTARTARRLGYRHAMLAEAGCTDAGRACHLPPAGALAREPFAATSHVLRRPVRHVAPLLHAIEQGLHVRGLVEGGVSFDALGAAVADLAPGATAFVHRDALSTAQYTVTWRVGATADAVHSAPYARLVRRLRATLAGEVGTGAYVNYADAELADWPAAYWGENYTRLRSVKREYDPHQVFRFAQSVRP